MISKNVNLKKVCISIIILVVILFIVPMIITIVTYNYHFNKRINHDNNYYEYLTFNNPNFTKTEVSFLSNENQRLYGSFYYDKNIINPKGLIIWVHGMGVSHENYLAEIEWFTKEDYLVFSYDNTGVENSEGKSLKGLTQAPIDLQHALKYVATLELDNLPIILVGHSWGGFSVATVSELDIPIEVDGIVTLAGFWRNINVITDIAKIYVGDVVDLLKPYLIFWEQLIFKENSNINGINGLHSTDAQVLIIHSTDDPIVRHSTNYRIGTRKPTAVG